MATFNCQFYASPFCVFVFVVLVLVLVVFVVVALVIMMVVVVVVVVRQYVATPGKVEVAPVRASPL